MDGAAAAAEQGECGNTTAKGLLYAKEYVNCGEVDAESIVESVCSEESRDFMQKILVREAYGMVESAEKDSSEWVWRSEGAVFPIDSLQPAGWWMRQ
ncbi:unnamed protein product, partial [Anisakis simplex]|uniref:Uncharacterized protein n=1 Tax=Anisakis simplex TaxID=6269 RepID=A0A0M3JLK3_ANISI